MNKKFNKMLVLFVTLLFTMQSFVPLIALANETDGDSTKLTSLDIVSENEEDVVADISAHISNTTDTEQVSQIDLNQGAEMSLINVEGINQEAVSVSSDQKILIKTNAKEEIDTKISFNIKRKSLGQASELIAKTTTQVVSAKLNPQAVLEEDTTSEVTQETKKQVAPRKELSSSDLSSGLEMMIELNGEKFNGVPVVKENDVFTFRLGYQAGTTNLIGKTVPVVFPEGLEITDSVLKVPAGNENIESITRDAENPQKLYIKFKEQTINQNGEFTISGKYKLSQNVKNEERTVSWSVDGEEGEIKVIEGVTEFPGKEYTNQTDKSVNAHDKYSVYQDADGKITLNENKDVDVRYNLVWETKEGIVNGTITDEMDADWKINPDLGTIIAKVTTTTIIDDLNAKTETKEYPISSEDIIIVDNKLTLKNVNLPANTKLELSYQADLTDQGKENLKEYARKGLEKPFSGDYIVKNVASFNGKEEHGDFPIGYWKEDTGTGPEMGDPNKEKEDKIIKKKVDKDFIKHPINDEGYLLNDEGELTTTDLNYQVDVNLNEFKTDGTNALKENTVLEDILPYTIEYDITKTALMHNGVSIGTDVSDQFKEVHSSEMVGKIAEAPVYSYAIKDGRLYMNLGKNKDDSYQLEMTLRVKRVLEAGEPGNYKRPTWSVSNWAVLNDGKNSYQAYTETKIEKKDKNELPVDDQRAFRKNGAESIQVEKGESATIDYAFEINTWDAQIMQFDDFELIDWVNLDYFDEESLSHSVISGELGWNERNLADLLTFSIGEKNDKNEIQLIIRPNEKFKEMAASFPNGKRLKINLSLKTKVFDKKVLLNIKNTATFSVKGHDEIYTSTKETEVNSFGDEMALDKQVASMDEQEFKKNLDFTAKENPEDNIVVYQIKLLPNGNYTGTFGFNVLDELPKDVEFLGFVPERDLFKEVPTKDNRLTEMNLVDQSGEYKATFENNKIEIRNEKGNNIKGQSTSVYFYARINSLENEVVNTLKNTDVEAVVVPNVTSLSVEKIWEDYKNTFKTRPGSIEIALFQNGEEFKTVSVDSQEGDIWHYTFANLPKKDADGNNYQYEVKEVNVDENYTSKVEDTTITNTYINQETTEVPVTKVWNDYSNQFNTRPETITVELLKNGEVVATEKVTGDSDKWSYTFKNLPKYDNKGKEYSYSVKEIKVPENYISKVEGTTITNTYVNKETTELPVTKIWNDYSNQFNTRPETITVELLKNGEVVATEKVTGDSDKWSYTFKNLPKYDNKGKEYSYSVKEIKVPENYTSKVEGTTITNTYVNKETTELPVTKVWNDYSNQFNTRPETITVELLKNGEVVATEKVTGETDKWSYTFKDLPKYDNKGKEYSYSVKEIKVPENYTSKVEGTTITNTYVNQATTELPVTKIWNDYSNQFNTRPEKITVELLKNDEVVATEKVTGDSNTWSYIFKDLPKYDNKGKEFSYSVKEIKVPSNYTSKVEGTTITNTYVNKETTELPVTKVWEDYSNQFNTRPENITVELLKNGEVVATEKVTGKTNTWNYTFKDLPKYDNKGKEFSYSVKEIKVPSNYTSKVEGTTITNTYVNQATTELPVTKVWNDYSNQFKTRPKNITVELLKNGEVVATEKVTGDSDKWSYTFKDLPKYDNKGKEFSYSVKEIKVPSNYTSKVEGTTITNTYVNKETTELPVTKVWEDYSNQFKIRPKNITVELLKNGKSEMIQEIKG
ncbi:Cna B-type domain-containing protein, partial [Vagococcus hydrophili]